MKTIRYTICDASGKIVKASVPTMFSPYEVAERCRHDLVFMHVAKGEGVYVDGAVTNGHLDGPAIVLVHQEHLYFVPKAPESDAEAFYLWRDYGPETKTQAA